MICPECRAPIGKNWTPYRILDSLSVVWRCPNGHGGQINHVEMIFAPPGQTAGRLPADRTG